MDDAGAAGAGTDAASEPVWPASLAESMTWLEPVWSMPSDTPDTAVAAPDPDGLELDDCAAWPVFASVSDDVSCPWPLENSWPIAEPTSAGRPWAAPKTPFAAVFAARPAPPVAAPVAADTTLAVTCTAALIAFGPTLPPRACMSAVMLLPTNDTAGMITFGLKHAMTSVATPISAANRLSAHPSTAVAT